MMGFLRWPFLLFLTGITLCDVNGQFLSATVGGSVLIPCSLPVHPLSLKWFYWQEEKFKKILFDWHTSGQTLPIAEEYKNRCQVFPTEFSSGNISIRLDNVTVGDDYKTFWAFVNLMDEKKVTKPSEQRCKFTLQVSAPFQKPNIEINQTEMTANCSTNGGYPEPELKWSGDGGTKLEPQKTTMTREADLTYNISSRVNVTGLQKVTCTVYNPTSNQTLTATKDVSPDEEPKSDTSLAVGLGVGLPLSIIIIIILLIVCWDRKHIRCVQNPQNQQNQRNVPDAQPNVSGQNQPEENIPLRRRNGAESSTDEDADSGGRAASGGADAEHDKCS